VALWSGRVNKVDAGLAMEPYYFDTSPELQAIGCTSGGELAESRSSPIQPCHWRGWRVSQHNCLAFRLHSRWHLDFSLGPVLRRRQVHLYRVDAGTLDRRLKAAEARLDSRR
jgi:hypothetical protein